ncbi:MAG: AbrB/MazE/SpoVT family DNA-binding domain-containing protein [Clostridiales bacterium]|jgi:antitoxin VapB|nr:AbrB/MazE/SpoVT family DNA-binding domain-containing protein [Clostridiales bacterium]MBQ4217897.1 AbrB/MazE/SpoVT family DNA-binding domain-containing protein [Clostridiales bacterium]MBQ7628278.1 AbrB/MazE/SpoVT family DNA-binding domain-containing protein [Clostridiales bacterium]
MTTAKIFENGRSQAVRLPKEYRFDSDEVMINRIGDIVMLIPKTAKWESFRNSVDMFSVDFMVEGRDTQILQERESL